MTSVHKGIKKELIDEYLEDYFKILILELDTNLESTLSDLAKIKDNFQAALDFMKADNELKFEKSSLEIRTILMTLYNHGKLVSVEDRSTLLDLIEILLQFLNTDVQVFSINEFFDKIYLNLSQHTCKKFTKSDVNLFTFYLLDKLLALLISKNIQCYSIERLETLVINTVLSCANDILCVILHSLIPNFIIYSNSNRILEKLWYSMSSDCMKNCSNAWDFRKCHDEQCLPRKISILCMLAHYYISTNDHSFQLVTLEHFWVIIYNGLTNNVALYRKKALYLLKRSVDFFEVNCSTFESNYFFWNENYVSHLKEIWKDVIIVLEVLEEKQLHLITPVLSVVMKLTVINNIVGEVILKECWLSCVCQRLMNHESIQVVRWGIVNFICADVFFLKVGYDYCLLKIILNSLNNTSLYSKSQETDNYLIEESIKNWFVKFTWFSDKRFLKNIIDLFCDVSWAPVPLFHVVRALSQVCVCNYTFVLHNSSTGCYWNNSTLKILKKFIMETLGTQNVHIRGAVQCSLIRCVINLTDTSDLDCKTLFDLLSVFRSSECLKRGTPTWGSLVHWLRRFIDESKVLTFIRIEIDDMLEKSSDGSYLSVETISRSIILMSDTQLSNSITNIPVILTPILDLFNQPCSTYSKPLDKALLLLTSLVSESEISLSEMKPVLERFAIDETRESVFSLTLKCMRSAISYIETGFRLWYDYSKDISSIQIHLDFISCFGSCERTKGEMKESILKLVTDSYKVLIDETSCNPVKKYFSLMLVSWVAKYNCSKYKECSSVSSDGVIAKTHQLYVGNLLREQKINRLVQGKDLKLCNDSIHSKIASSCVLAGWSLFHSYIVSFETALSEIKSLIEIEQLVELGLEATQIGGKDVLSEINQVFGIILPYYINELEVITISRFISTTWETCFELRKNELFWSIFKSWIKMFYQDKLLENDKCRTLHLEFANKILELGESVGGLSNCLFQHLNEEIINPDMLCQLSFELIVKALVFGPVHRKDLRIENEVCNFIKSKGNEYSINTLKPLTGNRDDCEVRLYTLNLILKVCVGTNNEIKAPTVLISIIESLMMEDLRISDKKKRYYGDSHHHRVKNRILQVLLVLEHVLFQSNSVSSEAFYEKLLDWLSDNLSRESHQPSIRYQLQWLFVRCLLHRPHHLPKFWIMFEKGSEERAGSVCSYISIAYHLAAVLRDDAFSSRCVEEIVPWCMAQHFNVRMYAQFVLSKLWSINETSGWSDEHKVIRTSLVKSLSKGSAIKNLPKLESDFYFSNFHPMKNFSLKSVFIELPRLSSVTPDEWCSETALDKCLRQSFNVIPLDDPIFSSDNMKPLADCKPATWTFKTRESAECTMGTDIIQKKFVPWRDMLTDEDSSSANEKKKEGLIVVASLIDRPPNLGGLSRTCEVFGVSELVLNSLHYLADKQFTSLSMSSEKHVNITEVKEYHLTDYIQTMKRSGFSVVGAEQTAGSVELTKFKFPLKTVLVLGNEKEGIPANMLPLLDACIVVPQYGLVRSLNVHVTGALFIWEYAKQYK